MTFKELENAVKRETEDFSKEFFTDIPSVINEVYLTACDEIDPGVPSLESLKSLDTVVGEAFMDQPPKSSGKIIAVYNQATKDKLTLVDGGLMDLREKVGSLTEEGAVKYWIPSGFSIAYAPIPLEATALDIIYYQNPAELTGDNDVPLHIPAHLHRSLLVHGTAFHLFSRIEQEGEGESQETQKQLELFRNGSDKFQTWALRRQRMKGRIAWDA